MKLITVLLLAGCGWPQSHTARSQEAPSSALASNAKASKSETLRYNVNWPSGLSLGEGQLTSGFEDGKWSFAFLMEAAVPGFVLREGAKAKASAEYCSLELEKNGARGKRKVDETTTFDQKGLTAVRKTGKGGKSDLTIPACAKDALTFLYFLRRELAAGRLPQVQDVYYGAAYRVRVQYTGVQTIRIGGEPVEADVLAAAIKGPASESKAEMFFARDAARTPLLIRSPLALGTFSLELQR
jgi:hypothetical protein